MKWESKVRAVDPALKVRPTRTIYEVREHDQDGSLIEILFYRNQRRAEQRVVALRECGQRATLTPRQLEDE